MDLRVAGFFRWKLQLCVWFKRARYSCPSEVFSVCPRLNEFPKHISGEGCEFQYKSDMFQCGNFPSSDGDSQRCPNILKLFLLQPNPHQYGPCSLTSPFSCFVIWCRLTVLRSVNRIKVVQYYPFSFFFFKHIMSRGLGCGVLHLCCF